LGLGRGRRGGGFEVDARGLWFLGELEVWLGRSV